MTNLSIWPLKNLQGPKVKGDFYSTNAFNFKKTVLFLYIKKKKKVPLVIKSTIVELLYDLAQNKLN